VIAWPPRFLRIFPLKLKASDLKNGPLCGKLDFDAVAFPPYPVRPIRPTPSRSTVAGSGTGEPPLTKLTLPPSAKPCIRLGEHIRHLPFSVES
jgi:hypothetical protein